MLAALALLFALAQLTEAALVDHPGVRAVTLVFAVLTPVPLIVAWRAPLAACSPSTLFRRRRGPRRRLLRPRSRSSCA